jgi:hypothetical protein
VGVDQSGRSAPWQELMNDAVPVIAAILVLWFVNIGVTGWLAERRGRDGGLWSVIAVFIGPLALLAVVLASPIGKDPKDHAR